MALRDLLASFVVRVDKTQLVSADRQINRTAKSTQSLFQQLGGLRTAFAGFAALAGVRILGNFVSELRETGDELDKTSQQLGITVGQLQSFRHAAGLGGASSGEASKALKDLQRNLQDAASGGSTTVEMFDILGVKAADAQGNVRDLESVLPEIADAFAGLTNTSEKTAVAATLFGRAGVKLIPTLNKGAAGLAAMRAELDEFGGGLDAESIQQAAELTDSIARMDLAFLSVKNQLAKFLIPTIDFFTRVLARTGGAVARFFKGTERLKIGLGLLGTGGLVALIKRFGGLRAILTRLRPLFGILARVAARFLLPFLILDDIITTFQGGDTVIRAFIDDLFGVGATTEIIEGLKTLIGDVFTLITGQAPTVENLKKAWRSVGDAIKAFYQFLRDTLKSAAALIGIFFSDTDEERAMWEREFFESSKLISEAFDQAFADAGAAVEAFALSIGEVLGPYVLAVENAVEDTRAKIRRSWDDALAWVSARIEAFVNGALARFSAVGDALKNLGSGEFGAAFENIKTVVTGDSPATQNVRRGGSDFGGAPPPTAPTGGVTNRSEVTLNDQRQISVAVGNGGAQPGATGREVAARVSPVLERDRRAILEAVR